MQPLFSFPYHALHHQFANSDYILIVSLLPGIPIIHNMQGSYVGDSIQSVMGIMNGTTNFMLTKMETEGADYAVVLKEAQDLGFAEGN